MSTAHPLEPATRPEYVYKYRSLRSPCEWRRLLRIITDNTIYYAAPASFNDPFDCKIPPVDSFEPSFVRYLMAARKAVSDRDHDDVYDKFVAMRARTRAELDELSADLNPAEQREFRAIEAGIQQRVDETGVLSFSAVCDSTLMWSHYADNHRGVCLIFSLEKWPVMQAALYPVEYPVARLSPQFDRRSFDDGQLFRAAALTKDRGWKYEQEWRVSGKAPGEFPFPPDALAGIIFGCMTTDADKARITHAVAGRTHIALLQAKMKKREFGLDILPC